MSCRSSPSQRSSNAPGINVAERLSPVAKD
jgi:hypothetical protein